MLKHFRGQTNLEVGKQPRKKFQSRGQRHEKTVFPSVDWRIIGPRVALPCQKTGKCDCVVTAEGSEVELRVRTHCRSHKRSMKDHLNLVSHRYVSGVLKDDHFVSARSILIDRGKDYFRSKTVNRPFQFILLKSCSTSDGF